MFRQRQPVAQINLDPAPLLKGLLHTTEVEEGIVVTDHVHDEIHVARFRRLAPGHGSEDPHPTHPELAKFVTVRFDDRLERLEVHGPDRSPGGRDVHV